jgi:NDP-sugar pyrophosphorylase family protein
MRYNKTIENSNSNPFSENVFVSHDSRVENTIIWENTSINNKSIIIDSIITGNVTLNHVNYHHKIITALGIYEL